MLRPRRRQPPRKLRKIQRYITHPHPFHILRKGISPNSPTPLSSKNRPLHPAPQRKQGKRLPRPTAKLRPSSIRKSSQPSRQQRYRHTPFPPLTTKSSAHHFPPFALPIKTLLTGPLSPLQPSRSPSLAARKTQIRRPRDPFPRQPARPGDPDRLSHCAAGEGGGWVG